MLENYHLERSFSVFSVVVLLVLLKYQSHLHKHEK